MSTPSPFDLADELRGRVLAEARTAGLAVLPGQGADQPADGPLALPADQAKAYALQQLRFAAQVVRELDQEVSYRLAEQARAAGATVPEINDARADRSPAELRADYPGPHDA
jgi:hypothetical protein